MNSVVKNLPNRDAGDARRRKLVYVITSMTYGGAETQVCELATRFAKRDWDVSLISLRTPTAFVAELTGAGVDVHSLDTRSRFPTPGECLRLGTLLRRLKPTLVHSHMYRANIASRLARPLARTPVLLCTAHNVSEGGAITAASGATELIYRFTDRFCDLTTNVSNAAVERYVRLRATPADRIRMMPNGIDLSRFTPKKSDGADYRRELRIEGNLAVLAIGRLEPQKNFPLLLRAFAEVHPQFPESVLLVVGEGALDGELKRLATELYIADRVRFLGIRNDVPDLMRSCDVYAMSSIYEGLPIVLLEAAACGLPIVATDVGGNAEIVRHEETGFIVPSESISRFAEALARLLAMSAEERCEVGLAGRRHVETNYEIERVVERWESLYDELLEGTQACLDK